MKCKVGIVGGGISGLMTAYRLLLENPTVQVTIICEEHWPDTTSAVAAGIWLPEGDYGPSENTEKLAQWFRETQVFLQHNLANGNSVDLGIMPLLCLELSPAGAASVKPEYHSIIPMRKELSISEVNKTGIVHNLPSQIDRGFLVSCFIFRPLVFLPWVAKEIKNMGGKFDYNRRIDSFASLKNEFDVVINCSGLGSKFLVADDKMVPIRGQVIIVEAPWITYGLFIGFETYVLPGPDGTVTLGGCYQVGNDDLRVNYELKEAIWNRCCKAVPSLKKAKFIADRVGLRPMRWGGPRVELDLTGNGLPVIHNYGHGPNGWGTSWGTAGEVTQILKQYQKNKFQSNL